MTPQHHLPAVILGPADDLAQVADRHVHAPTTRERNRLVGRGGEVRADVRDRSASRGSSRRPPVASGSRDVLVEDRVVLEQVLAALDRPHLPPGESGDDVLGVEAEVRGAGRRPGSSTRTFSASAGPTSRILTRLYWSGPASTPLMVTIRRRRLHGRARVVPASRNRPTSCTTEARPAPGPLRARRPRVRRARSTVAHVSPPDLRDHQRS